jgi:hypothetical protein
MEKFIFWFSLAAAAIFLFRQISSTFSDAFQDESFSLWGNTTGIIFVFIFVNFYNPIYTFLIRFFLLDKFSDYMFHLDEGEGILIILFFLILGAFIYSCIYIFLLIVKVIFFLDEKHFTVFFEGIFELLEDVVSFLLTQSHYLCITIIWIAYNEELVTVNQLKWPGLIFGISLFLTLLLHTISSIKISKKYGNRWRMKRWNYQIRILKLKLAYVEHDLRDKEKVSKEHALKKRQKEIQRVIELMEKDPKKFLDEEYDFKE